ncbi:MAG: hypothetical protein Q8L27_03460 [archaeon]|nr:hypothetical protein [archaeon]
MINREDRGYTEFLFYIPQDFFLTWDKFCLLVDKDTIIDKTKVKNARKLKSAYIRKMIEKYVLARESLLR